jgi:hypothetical protein
MFNATLTSTSIGGTSVDTVQVVITNVAPVTNAGPDKMVNEGTALPMAMTFVDPGSGDTWTFNWAWGDTTTSNAQNVNKTWADNGVFNVTARVTDDDGGTSTDIAVVTVANVAPTITSTPSNMAREAQQYTYTITVTDPGTADTHTCSAPVRPMGSQLVGCQLVWTPDFSQAIGAAVPVRMCVTDDDGGQTCQDYTVTVQFLDSDGDGLPDSWEISNFGNIGAQDQFGDPDMDGMNNLQEFTNVTDPLTYDGPNAPVPQAPMCGSEIASLQTVLTVTNAVDPQGTPLLYQFQLYSDIGLTILVAETINPAQLVPQGAGATTSWPVPVNLLENTRYFWRARAKDQFTFGPFNAPAAGLGRGKVWIEFRIAPDGKVDRTTITDDEFHGAAGVARCVAKLTLDWAFPPPAGGGMVVVRYPFLFVPEAPVSPLPATSPGFAGPPTAVEH